MAVCNNCGPGRVGQFNSQNAMNGWCGDLALPAESRLSHGSIETENYTGTRLQGATDKVTWQWLELFQSGNGCENSRIQQRTT
jgi:hypothetical protein